MMPLYRKSPRARKSPPAGEQEETVSRQPGPGLAQAVPGQPGPDLAQAVPGQPGRPYRDFVESEARKYWQTLAKQKPVVKPDREQLRKAAMPVLVQGLRRRTGSGKYVDPVLALHAVVALQMYALDRGWIRHPCYTIRPGQSYVGILIELSKDARWRASFELAKSALYLKLSDKFANFKPSLCPNPWYTLLIKLRAADNLDGLCALFDEYSLIERQEQLHYSDSSDPDAHPVLEPATAPEFPAPPTFTLGEKRDLDAGAATAEIALHLRAFCHPFIRQVVNDMELGRGMQVTGNPGLWIVTSGVLGLGYCSVFYYVNRERREIRIAGIGQRMSSRKYRLDFASEELGVRGQVLRLPKKW